MAKISGVILFAIFAMVSCNSVIEFVEHNHNFVLDSFAEMLKKSDIKGKNFVYSPYSIQAAGAMLYAGADGKTAEEMVTGFKLPSSDPKVVGESFKSSLTEHLSNSLFKIANKIYVAEGYSAAPKFEEILRTDFHSEIESLAFKKSKQAADTINKWIDEKTAGKIHDLVKSEYLDEDTRMLLVNAIHFKGAWNTKFDKSSTKLGDFYTTPTEKVQVEMMTTKAALKYKIFSEYDVMAVEYGFKDSDASMFFILPAKHENSLDEVEAKLPELVEKFNIFNKLDRETDARLFMPKFKIEFELDLKEMLVNLGMPHLFKEANFNNLLSKPEPLEVSKALHKATIEVNEEGAEAAAASVVITQARSGRFYFPVKLDQSFLYFIKGRNGEIYFMGRFTGK